MDEYVKSIENIAKEYQKISKTDNLKLPKKVEEKRINKKK
jgi:hypothetical protein